MFPDPARRQVVQRGQPESSPHELQVAPTAPANHCDDRGLRRQPRVAVPGEVERQMPGPLIAEAGLLGRRTRH